MRWIQGLFQRLTVLWFCLFVGWLVCCSFVCWSVGWLFSLFGVFFVFLHWFGCLLVCLTDIFFGFKEFFWKSNQSVTCMTSHVFSQTCWTRVSPWGWFFLFEPNIWRYPYHRKSLSQTKARRCQKIVKNLTNPDIMCCLTPCATLPFSIPYFLKTLLHPLPAQDVVHGGWAPRPFYGSSQTKVFGGFHATCWLLETSKNIPLLAWGCWFHRFVSVSFTWTLVIFHWGTWFWSSSLLRAETPSDMFPSLPKTAGERFRDQGITWRLLEHAEKLATYTWRGHVGMWWNTSKRTSSEPSANNFLKWPLLTLLANRCKIRYAHQPSDRFAIFC